MEQEYTVALLTQPPGKMRATVFDETSVDAESPEEAIETAADVFGDVYPGMSRSQIKEKLRIVKVEPMGDD